jgi:hypothetical protein
MRLLFVLASLAAALVAVGEASPAPTDDLALQLTWEAPQGCPDLASERAEIRRRAGDTSHVLSAPIVAQGTIQRVPSGGYDLLLHTRVDGTQGERLLAGDDCRQLADAAALVLALLINPEASLSGPQPAPAAPTQPPSPPVALPRPDRPRAGLGLGLAAAWASGVLPGGATGLSSSVFYQRESVALVFLVTGFLPKDKSAPVLPHASASFYRLESALQLCASTSSDRPLGAALCLGGAIVRLHGQSTGVSDPGQATAYWPEATLAGSGRLRLTAATQLRLAVDLHGLGSRPDFAIAGLGNVYRPARFSMRGILGIEMLF